MKEKFTLLWVHQFWSTQLYFLVEDAMFIIYLMDLITIFIFFKFITTTIPYMLGIRPWGKG